MDVTGCAGAFTVAVDLLIERVLLHLDAPNEVAHRVGELDVEELGSQLMHATRKRVQEAQRREFEQSGVGENATLLMS